MDNDFATGYALGSDSGNGNNSGFGGWGDGLWAIIILAMIWGGNGWAVLAAALTALGSRVMPLVQM